MKASSKLILFGVLSCIGGVIFEQLSLWLISEISRSSGLQSPDAGLWLVEVVTAVIRYGALPLGAALIAIGIAVRVLGERVRLDGAQ